MYRLALSGPHGTVCPAKMAPFRIATYRMYGYTNGSATYNPASGDASCPPEFTSAEIFGTTGVDFPVVFCFKARN